MKTQPTPRAGRPDDPRRKLRPRPMPKWILKSEQLDAMARSRCLLVLSVLSGELPVTEAIAQANISRGTYYQLEDKALKAMLAVLNPLASTTDQGTADLTAAACRIAELEDKVKQLEQETRRSERLLYLTRKSLKAPVTTGRRGRLPGVPNSTRSGVKRWASSTAKVAPPSPSTPTPTGETRP